MPPGLHRCVLAGALWVLLGGAAAAQDAADTDVRIGIDSAFVRAEVALQNGDAALAAEQMLIAAMAADDPAYAERATRFAEEARLTDIGLQALGRWSELAPDDDRTAWYWGVFRTRTGDFESAVGDFSRVVAGLPPERAGAGLALVYEMLTAEPNTAGTTFVMNALVEQYPDYPEGHYGLARLALRSGNFELCLTHARAAVASEPDWLEARLLLARALLVAGQTEESLALAAEIAGEFDSPEIRLQQAELLLSAGRSAEAEALLDEITTSFPDLVEAKRALAFLRLAEDDLDSAEVYFEELRNNPPYQTEAFYYLGRIAESRGDSLQATRAYARVVEGTHVIEAQLRIARLLFDQSGDVSLALRHLTEFGRENPAFASQMIVARSQILAQTDRHDEAMEMLEAALEQAPADGALQSAHVQIFVELAQIAMDEPNLDAAEELLDAVLTRYPGNASARYAQSLLLQRQGRMRRAANVLEDLVEDNPDNPVFLNAYGYLLTDRMNRHEEAEGYIRRALALDPDNAAIIDSMGWVLFNLGDPAAALDYLQRAFRLYNDPEVIAHLVDTHWALGQQEIALELLLAGLEAFPGSEFLTEVQQRISQ